MHCIYCPVVTMLCCDVLPLLFPPQQTVGVDKNDIPDINYVSPPFLFLLFACQTEQVNIH